MARKVSPCWRLLGRPRLRDARPAGLLGVFAGRAQPFGIPCVKLKTMGCTVPNPIDEARRLIQEARAMRAEAARQRERVRVVRAEARRSLRALRAVMTKQEDRPAPPAPAPPSETA